MLAREFELLHNFAENFTQFFSNGKHCKLLAAVAI